MPQFQALYFLGSDPKPFYIEEIEAESLEGAIREGYRLIVEQVPIGVSEGPTYTTYLPWKATHFTVREKPEPVRFRPL